MTASIYINKLADNGKRSQKHIKNQNPCENKKSSRLFIDIGDNNDYLVAIYAEVFHKSVGPYDVNMRPSEGQISTLVICDL